MAGLYLKAGSLNGLLAVLSKALKNANPDNGRMID